MNRHYPQLSRSFQTEGVSWLHWDSRYWQCKSFTLAGNPNQRAGIMHNNEIRSDTCQGQARNPDKSIDDSGWNYPILRLYTNPLCLWSQKNQGLLKRVSIQPMCTEMLMDGYTEKVSRTTAPFFMGQEITHECLFWAACWGSIDLVVLNREDWDTTAHSPDKSQPASVHSRFTASLLFCSLTYGAPADTGFYLWA